MKKQLLTIALIAFSYVGLKAQTTASDLVINIKTKTNPDHSLTVKWQGQVGATGYNVLRKTRNTANFTTIASNLSLTDSSFTDTQISEGEAFEYCVQASNNPNISGYVYAGEKLPIVHQAGRVLLVIDKTYQTAAAAEINGYKLDLIKEGWKVNCIYVDRTQSATSVKGLINNQYNTYYSDLKGIILLGHVPVPYSGKIAPDAHTDHVGAWPADMYYGNVQLLVETSTWNDAVLNVSTSTDPRNFNLIGDGKFDVSTKSTVSNTKLFVSRVDVYNMPTINADDVFLFKQYLTKNHNYRAGIKKFNYKSVVDDNFGFQYGEAFAQNGWRNFSALVGSENTVAGDYLTSLKTSSHIWSYGCGGGWNTGSSGIGNTADFTTNQAEGVFTMLFGSYFGDWDTKNNFLRAPIASPSSTLVSFWGGRPNWFLHTMALGEPIGYSYLNSINNTTSYYPKGLYADQIHQAIQGDATLKMYVLEAPKNFTVIHDLIQNNVKLSWASHQDADVLGYYVYRAASIDDEFQLLQSTMVTSNEFIDATAEALEPNNNFVYMVKAVKLENSTTGSFYNASPGEVAYRTELSTPLPLNLLSFVGSQNQFNENELSWVVANEKNLLGYSIERSANQLDYESIGFVNYSNAIELENHYAFTDKAPLKSSFYRLKMIDLDGKIAYSNIVSIQSELMATETSVYPNPFVSTLHVNIDINEAQQITCQLVDILGHTVLMKTINANNGMNNFDLDKLESLSNGMYFLNILNEESSIIYQNSVVK